MHESQYIMQTPIEYRKEFGQFFTPSSVAGLMAKWVMKHKPKNILDPAFGLGVFYDEINKIRSSRQSLFTGYEIDNHILTYFDSRHNGNGLRIINDDYLEADISGFDAIICNPPYMRFQKFLTRHDVLPKIEKKIGRKLVGYANIASVFLVKALKELNANGRLAFIMPFEFFNAGYGREIKNNLLETNLLKQIIIFSNEKTIFPDAITTVCILFCKKNDKDDGIKITLIEDADKLNQIPDISGFYQHKINKVQLPYHKKWTPIIYSLVSDQQIPIGFCRLSQYGSFKRGIATGANEFFALTRSKIEGLNLGRNNLCKCITKSPQIKKPIFTEDDFYSLYKTDKPVYCLNVQDHQKPEVRNYLRLGEKSGYHKRYLTRARTPWYKIEYRQPAPILFGVFNRGRLKVIRNFTQAVNFTCFHSFYPNIFGELLTDKLFIYFLSDIGQDILKTNKRSYGNNLDKFEPGDLNESLCPTREQFETIKQAEVKKVIDIARENEEMAIEISNRLIKRILDQSGCTKCKSAS